MEWIQKVAPLPTVWTDILNNLEAVCRAGCDANDPFGASNTTDPNVTVPSIVLNGNTYVTATFNDVINAYKTEGFKG